MSLAISTAKMDITPPIGTPLAGWGVDTPRLSTGANAPLFVRCTVFWDSGVPNVIITCDTLVIPRSVNLALRSRIEPLGIGHSDLIITATHTHNGGALDDELVPFISYNVTTGSPADLAVKAYTTQLENSVVACVQAALTAPQTPCSLGYQVASQSFSYNREGLSYVETVVPVLTARDGSGKLLAVLFGYGAHPVSGDSQTVADPDYPGWACSYIEGTGVFAQFLLGPAGDQDPIGSWSLPYAQSLGQSLGQAVLAAPAGQPVSGPIDTAYRDLTVPLDVTATPANLTAVRGDYVTREGNSSLPGYYRRHAQVMVSQIDANSFATGLNIPVQTWGFQGLRLALTGGELISGYAVYLRSRYGGAQGIWVCGYANEVPCYVPSNELLTNGGINYASGWFTDFPGIAGGAMTVYGCLGHFKVPPNDSTNSVESIILTNIQEML